MDHSGSIILVVTKVDILMPCTSENIHMKFEENPLKTVGEIDVLKNLDLPGLLRIQDAELHKNDFPVCPLPQGTSLPSLKKIG